VVGSPSRTSVTFPYFNEAFGQCLESSGYSQQKVWDSLPYQGRDTSDFPLIVEASNEWAACAREHGISGIKDAVLPDPLSQDYPTVLLPTSITEQELRQLLAVCPNYDVTMEAHNLQLWQEWGQSHDEPGGRPDGLIFQPSIGFDYPDFDGRFAGDKQPLGPLAPPPPPDVAAMQDHLANLMDILRESEFLFVTQAQGNVENGVEPPDTGPNNVSDGSAVAPPSPWGYPRPADPAAGAPVRVLDASLGVRRPGHDHDAGDSRAGAGRDAEPGSTGRRPRDLGRGSAWPARRRTSPPGADRSRRRTSPRGSVAGRLGRLDRTSEPRPTPTFRAHQPPSVTRKGRQL